MKIQLKRDPRAAFEEIEVEKGTTIETIYKRIEHELPYKIVAAKVNYKYEGLTYALHRECRVELLDMRTQAANLVYQSSLSLLYLKAVYDVLGDVEVDIENALNKGLYTEIKRETPVTAKEVRQIQSRMEALVKADLPLIKEALSKEEAIAFFEKRSGSMHWAAIAISFTGAWCHRRAILLFLNCANIAAAYCCASRIRAIRTGSRIMWMSACCIRPLASRAVGASSWGSITHLTSIAKLKRASSRS